MEKKQNTRLLKELIEFDFAIAKSTMKKNNLNNVTRRINIKGKDNLNILDIFQLNQSLKQFIRILHFLQSAKVVRVSETGFRPRFVIYIWSINKFILDFINLYIKDTDLQYYIRTTEVCPVSTTKADRKKRKFLFILGNPWEITPERTLHEKILYNKFYLVNTLDFNAEKSEFNTYKIQNDLADYKKLIVLLIIIERILSINPLICKPISSRVKLFFNKKINLKKKIRIFPRKPFLNKDLKLNKPLEVRIKKSSIGRKLRVPSLNSLLVKTKPAKVLKKVIKPIKSSNKSLRSLKTITKSAKSLKKAPESLKNLEKKPKLVKSLKTVIKPIKDLIKTIKPVEDLKKNSLNKKKMVVNGKSPKTAIVKSIKNFNNKKK